MTKTVLHKSPTATTLSHKTVDHHLYTQLHRQLITTYRRKRTLWIALIISLISLLASLAASLQHGLTLTTLITYGVGVMDLVISFLTTLTAALLLDLLSPSDGDAARIDTGRTFLAGMLASPAQLATIKTVATAGSAAGQLRTTPALFILGFGGAIYGKGLIDYVTTPIQDMNLFPMLFYIATIIAVLFVLVEVQWASLDTDILKIVAYHEEDMADHSSPALPPATAQNSAPSPLQNTSKPKQTTQRTRKHRR